MTILRNPVLTIAVAIVATFLVAVIALLVHYTSDFRGLTFWSRTHFATVSRPEKSSARAWIYSDSEGDRLVYVQNDRQVYRLTPNDDRPELCGNDQLGWIGGRYIFTPGYAGRWKVRCVPMDGWKAPDTTWVSGQNSIDFHSISTDLPAERRGDWFVRW